MSAVYARTTGTPIAAMTSIVLRARCDDEESRALSDGDPAHPGTITGNEPAAHTATSDANVTALPAKDHPARPRCIPTRAATNPAITPPTATHPGQCARTCPTCSGAAIAAPAVAATIAAAVTQCAAEAVRRARSRRVPCANGRGARLPRRTG